MASHPNFTSISIVVCRVVRESGDRPSPLYVATLDADTGADFQVGVPKLHRHRQPPYPTGPQALLVTIHAEDLACLHLALGWRMPERIIDLIVEFRNLTNGRSVPCGATLAGALIWFGLPAAASITAAASSPAQVRQRLAILASLFQAIELSLDWGRALLRGRYLIAVGHIEMTGIPVDASTIQGLITHWSAVRFNLTTAIDADLDCFLGGRLQPNGFEAWLARRSIDWPRTAVGTLALSETVFKERARAHPELRPLKELRTTLAGYHPRDLMVSRDGRNRAPLRPFASRTGRNQPSIKATVLGGPKWTRFFIRPAPGMGLALIDWAQQEFGIAAALSGDATMQAAYLAGDPYMAFAIAAGAAPEGATRETHPDVREQFKACALGVQYGIGAASLGRMLDVSPSTAQRLLQRHKAIYRRFWRWLDNVEAQGLLRGRLQSVFGWQVAVGGDTNPRFVRNFPMQANGAEMLRLACCLTTEAGIRVCAPLHDALLIEARLTDLEAVVAETQHLMAEASAVVLDGFELRSEVRCVRYPERLGDNRDRAIWRVVEQAIEESGA